MIEVAANFQPIPQVGSHDLLVFLLQVCLMLGLALSLGRLSAKFGLPAVVGELLAGVLIGPSLLGHLSPRVWHWLFPSEAAQAHMIDAVAQVGVLLLVGVTGAHLDLAMVRKRRATAVKVSLGGLLIPLSIGGALGFILPATLVSSTTDRATFAVFIGVAMCVSAIPVIAKTLMDMKMAHRDIAQLTLAAAMIDDAVGWFLLSIASAMAIGGVRGGKIVFTLCALAGFILFSWLIARPVVRVAFRLASRSESPGATTATVVTTIFASAALTYALGLEAVFGAFVAGMLIGAPTVRKVIPAAGLAPVRTFVMGVGAPIFLATAGLRMDLAALGHRAVMLSALAVLAVAVFGKFAGAYLGGRLSRLSRRESIALGAGMNSRGVVEIVIALTGLRLGILTTATYTIIVLVAVATSVMAPPLLRHAMAGIKQTTGERLRLAEHGLWTNDPPVLTSAAMHEAA